ncbi:unnamed protein product [Echinostoma caproni]|uniref:Uncharacterized protein n=1 Tax=Echinostoma caproni TaxID=27848 RepID=A0A183AUA8_9TREM|nr:unnamed protein product [Echinostoma caproni]
MQTLSPAQARIQQRQLFFPHELSSCSHVLVRVDSVSIHLKQPCGGPFRVISRHDTTFKVDRHGRVGTIGINRLKAAYFDENVHANTESAANPSQPLNETPVSRLGSHDSPAAPALDEASASRPSWQPPQLATAPNEASPSNSSWPPPLPAMALDEAIAFHSDRQPRASVTISDVTSVLCPSQPNAALSRPSNETSVSRSG